MGDTFSSSSRIAPEYACSVHARGAPVTRTDAQFGVVGYDDFAYTLAEVHSAVRNVVAGSGCAAWLVPIDPGALHLPHYVPADSGYPTPIGSSSWRPLTCDATARLGVETRDAERDDGDTAALTVVRFARRIVEAAIVRRSERIAYDIVLCATGPRGTASHTLVYLFTARGAEARGAEARGAEARGAEARGAEARRVTATETATETVTTA